MRTMTLLAFALAAGVAACSTDSSTTTAIPELTPELAVVQSLENIPLGRRVALGAGGTVEAATSAHFFDPRTGTGTYRGKTFSTPDRVEWSAVQTRGAFASWVVGDGQVRVLNVDSGESWDIEAATDRGALQASDGSVWTRSGDDYVRYGLDGSRQRVLLSDDFLLYDAFGDRVLATKWASATERRARVLAIR